MLTLAQSGTHPGALRRLSVRSAIFVLMAILCGVLARRVATAGDTENKAQPVRPFAVDKRVPWNSSKVVGTPDPPAPYRTRQVFSKLKFHEPVAMTWAPGSNRLLMVERRSKLYTFENSPTVEKADLLLDIGQLGKATYGAAFYPKFQTNGYLYVSYVIDDQQPMPAGSRV